jgi:hypothetical protein
MTTAVAVSPGDQKALVEAAKPLGIVWTVPVEGTAEELLEAAQEKIYDLEQANAQLLGRLNEEKARAERAEAQSAGFLKIIEAAKAALGV